MPGLQALTGSLAALEALVVAALRQPRARRPVVWIGHRLQRPYLQERSGLAEEVRSWLRTTGELAQWLDSAKTRGTPPRRPKPAQALRLRADLARQAGDYFARVREQAGFARALGDLLELLEREGIDAAALRRLASHVDNPAKLLELADLRARYAECWAAFQTEAAAVWRADPAALKSPRVLVFGLERPSAGEWRLLDGLAARVPVTVLVPDLDTTFPTGDLPLVSALAKRGVIPTPLPSTPSSKPAWQLVSAPDPTREVAEVARACLRWAAAGIPFADMAVGYPAGGAYRRLLIETFERAGIRYYLHDRLRLGETPAGLALARLLELVGAEVPRNGVMAWLAEADVPAATAIAYSPFEPAQWDLLSRRAGIVGGIGQWRDRLHRLAYDLERLHHAREGEGAPPALRILDSLTRFIVDLANALEAWPAVASQRTHLERLRVLARTYIEDVEPVLAALEQAFDPEEDARTLPFVEFRQLVLALLEQINAPETGPARLTGPGVKLLDFQALRYLRFRAVALVGLAAGRLPARTLPDPLLLDGERAQLNALTGAQLPLASEQLAAQALLFALALEAGQEQRWLSYPRQDAAAGQLPSPYFLAVVRRLTGRRVRAAELDQLDEPWFVRLPASRLGAATLAEALDALEYDLTWLREPGATVSPEFIRTHPHFEAGRAAWVARRTCPSLTVYDGLLGEERPAALAEWTGRALAPTQLEEFATCPYRFLGLRVLRLETVPEPELREQISELDKGDLVHVVLRRFVAESCAQDPHQIGPLARLLEILEEEAAERTRRGQTGLPVLWRLELSRLRADLTQWWRAERARWCPGGDQPVALELRFGPPRGDDPGDPRSTDAPLLVRTASRTLRFVGRLDRVDRMATGGWRVIDYKTGNLEQAAPNQFRGGTQLQLPLYLLAVRHVLGDAGGPNVAEYVSVTRKGDFRRVRWEEAVLAGPRHPEFQALLDGLVEAIEQGVFPPRPGPDGEICAYCPIAPVCGPEIALTMARKGGDPAVRALEQIAHIP